MKSKGCFWLAQMAVFALALTYGAAAQNPRSLKISGTINDYTAGAQPWEMRGTWSLRVHPDTGTADFTAALNMEHSDLAIVDGATGRVPHTHHITMTNAQVISNPSDVASDCPSTQYSPKTTTGIAVIGMASITGNGAFAPFAPNGELSQLTVCVTGADQVTFSNLTLVFPATKADGSKNPAVGHFGSQPIDGVVVKANGDDD